MDSEPLKETAAGGSELQRAGRITGAQEFPLHQPSQNSIRKWPSKVRRAFGPIHAKSDRRRAFRFETYLFRAAPGEALFCYKSISPLDPDVVAADQRSGEQNPKLTGQVTVAGA